MVPMQLKQRQSGAALIVGLVLMVVLTVLAVSTMNTATLELTMATNAQNRQNAFQAAETGIDTAIALRNWTTTGATIVPNFAPDPANPGVTTTATTNCIITTGVPDRAFSQGVATGSIEAFHFDIVALATAPRNARATNNQSFYVVGPGTPDPNC